MDLEEYEKEQSAGGPALLRFRLYCRGVQSSLAAPVMLDLLAAPVMLVIPISTVSAQKPFYLKLSSLQC